MKPIRKTAVATPTKMGYERANQMTDVGNKIRKYIQEIASVTCISNEKNTDWSTNISKETKTKEAQLEAMTAQIKSLMDTVATLSKSITAGVANNNGSGTVSCSGGSGGCGGRGGSGDSGSSGGSGNSGGSGSISGGGGGNRHGRGNRCSRRGVNRAAAAMATSHSKPYATWECTAQCTTTILLDSTMPA